MPEKERLRRRGDWNGLRRRGSERGSGRDIVDRIEAVVKLRSDFQMLMRLVRHLGRLVADVLIWSRVSFLVTM